MKNFISKYLTLFTGGAVKLPDTPAEPTEPMPPLTNVPGLRVENVFWFTREGMFYLVDSEGGEHVPSLVPDGEGVSKLVFTRMCK